MKYVLIIALATLFNFAHAAEMRSIRCPGGFVKLKMDKYKVMDLCGTPKDKEVISGDNQTKEERLIYKFKKSKSAPYTFFTFRSGKLTLIEKSKN
ncbi:DUF2845 domain-containing protein [Thalassotalea aquiviva]|uniref:DUF2845 domain-containing protein n=1 Tax=Thalassotalea aquiviva TaxID=3242415 RepID=UPI00352AAAE5